MRIGVTGHMNLTTATEVLVKQALTRLLAAYDMAETTGISCLADGADTIFAEVVLELGGSLAAIIPAADYRERRVKDVARFDNLVGRAAKVRVMPAQRSSREAYEAANRLMLSNCDMLIAIADPTVSAPAVKGGSVAVLREAGDWGLPVEVVWPDGSQRKA